MVTLVDSLPVLYTLYLPSLSPVIDFRAYSHEIDQVSVLDMLGRMLSEAGVAPDTVVLFHDAADRAATDRLQNSFGIAGFESVRDGKLAALADLARTFPDYAVAVFPVELVFAPPDLLLRAAAHHIACGNHYTPTPGLPASITPTIYSAELLIALDAVDYRGERPDPAAAVEAMLRTGTSHIASVPFDAIECYGAPPEGSEIRLASLRDAQRARAALTTTPQNRPYEALESWLVSGLAPPPLPAFTSVDSAASRVLHISLPSGFTGAENSLCQFIRFAPGHLNHTALVGVEGLFAQRLRQAGAEVICANWHFGEDSEECLQHARDVLAQARPSVIHINSYSGEPFQRAAAEAGIPVAVSVRIADASTFETAYAQARRVLAVSEFVRGEVIRFGVPAEKIAVAYSGVDTDAFDPSRYEKSVCRASAGLPADRIVILAGGTLIPLKRHAVLIAALAALLRQGSPVHMAITAAGAASPYCDRIRRLAEELKADAHITWLPFQFEMARLYAAADIFALASDCEGMPRSALEAMSMGLPVVAANSGGSREAVVDGITGLLAPSEPLDFSRALSRLVHDAPARCAMGYEGRRRARHFWSGPRRAAVMENLLADAARPQKHTR